MIASQIADFRNRSATEPLLCDTRAIAAGIAQTIAPKANTSSVLPANRDIASVATA
jgi:hypothetical protein